MMDYAKKIAEAVRDVTWEAASAFYTGERAYKLPVNLDATIASIPRAQPVYQTQCPDGLWSDQEKHSYEYNRDNGQTVRIVYAAPVSADPVNARLLDALKHAVGWARADVSCTKQDYDFYNELIAAAEQASNQDAE